MDICRAPETDDGGYGLEEPAPQPKQGVTKSLEPESYGRRATTTTKQQRKADEWSQWKGLRDAFISLIIRSVIAILVWSAIVWAVTPAMVWLRDNASGAQWIVLGLVSLIGGAAVGYILSRGLADRAGFVSPILAILAVGAAIACVLVGIILGSVLHGEVVFTYIPTITAIIMAGVLAAFKTMMDD